MQQLLCFQKELAAAPATRGKQIKFRGLGASEARVVPGVGSGTCRVAGTCGGPPGPSHGAAVDTLGHAMGTCSRHPGPLPAEGFLSA